MIWIGNELSVALDIHKWHLKISQISSKESGSKRWVCLTFEDPTRGCTWGEKRGSRGRHIPTDSDRRSAPSPPPSPSINQWWLFCRFDHQVQSNVRETNARDFSSKEMHLNRLQKCHFVQTPCISRIHALLLLEVTAMTFLLRSIIAIPSPDLNYYSDVIMSAIASQITSLTIVYPSVYSGADQRKHQSSASLAFALGIHQWPVHSPHKGPVIR